MVFEPGECDSTKNGGTTGVGIRDLIPQRSREMLPTAQSRSLVPGAGALRALVYGLAARAIAHAEESQEGGRTPLAERQKTFESEPPGGLDLGTSVGIHGQESNQLFAAVRSRISEYWLRAVHGNSK